MSAGATPTLLKLTACLGGVAAIGASFLRAAPWELSGRAPSTSAAAADSIDRASLEGRSSRSDTRTKLAGGAASSGHSFKTSGASPANLSVDGPGAVAAVAGAGGPGTTLGANEPVSFVVDKAKQTDGSVGAQAGVVGAPTAAALPAQGGQGSSSGTSGGEGRGNGGGQTATSAPTSATTSAAAASAPTSATSTSRPTGAEDDAPATSRPKATRTSTPVATVSPTRSWDH